jgi:hypothetical protein
MPATLYRLVGRDHHAVSAEPRPQESVADAPVDQKIDVVSESQPVEIVHDVLVESIVEQHVAQIEEAEVDPAPAVVEPVKALKQTWDSSMSRAQLVKVASSLGLVFTDKSTKSEILSLLESARKT